MMLAINSPHSKGMLYHWSDQAPSWALSFFEKDLRARQHASSRMAIKMLLETEFELTVEAQEIEIKDHQHIKDHPELKISLSHTKDAWALATICQSEKVLGLGVDLEFSNRQMRIGIEKLFMNDEDDWKDDLLKLWCFKEAAFKAISPLLNPDILNKTFVLKDIIVKENQFHLKGKDKILGEFEQNKLKAQDQEFLITEAFLFNLPE